MGITDRYDATLMLTDGDAVHILTVLTLHLYHILLYSCHAAIPCQVFEQDREVALRQRRNILNACG